MFPINFNFSSREWAEIKARLERDLEAEVGKLCNSGCSHDEANLIRGRIQYIKDILLTEKAATQGRWSRSQ